jgi:DNA-binding transcriptional LysR family regulator
MKQSNLRDVDLNLLVVLRELLVHGSVTRAAEHLGRSQSALSHALNRLRDLFDDPLLVRVGNDMTPTDLATSLREPLDRLLESAEHLLGQRRSFEPARLEREFRISGADYAHAVVLTRVLARVRAEAPGVSLIMTSVGNEVERALQSGEIDLALGGNFQPVSGLMVQNLFDERFVCVVRHDHPVIHERLTLDAFLAADHALATPRSLPGSIVDDALARQGLSRRVVLRSPQFLVVALAASTSDLVLTLPAHVAELMAPRLGLRILPPPIELPSFAFGQLFNAARQGDPAHAWLRRAIAAGFRD